MNAIREMIITIETTASLAVPYLRNALNENNTQGDK